MDMKRNSWLFLVMILCFSVLIAACSGDTKDKEDDGKKVDKEDKPKDSEEVEGVEFDPDEEITLRFMAPWGEAQVDSRFKDEFEKKYPNITIEPILEWPNQEELEKVYAKNIIPDVVLVLGDYQQLEEMDALTPLDDFVEKSGLDLSVYREGSIDAIRARDPQGEDRLLGLPVEGVDFALFYNKEVFDLFGVEYPHDGMTWEELVELIPKVTGERNGTEYVGLPTHSITQAFQQMSVTGTDPETGEVLFVQQPEFVKYFELIDRIVSIPGNVVKDAEKTHFKAGNVAMNILTVSNIPDVAGGESPIDFDIVQFPTWEDQPGVMPNNLPLTLAINPNSENKEAAFKLLEFVGTKEQQINMAKVGVAPVLNDPEIAEYLSGDADINIQGIYAGTPAKPAEYSKYGPEIILYASNFLGTKTTEFIEQRAEGKAIDIITFIREMKEEYETVVKERQAKE